MTNNNESLWYLKVDIENNKPSTRLISEEVFAALQQADESLVTLASPADLQRIRSEYDDVSADTGAKWYPELNTLFTYLQSLLIDTQGDGQPYSNQRILLDVPLRRKANV